MRAVDTTSAGRWPIVSSPGRVGASARSKTTRSARGGPPKPQTFMTLGGRAAQPLAKFYTVPLERMLVIYDDLDLPFGAIRLRMKGGAGGHNGMRSIIDRMGTDGFPRLRVGGGRPP